MSKPKPAQCGNRKEVSGRTISRCPNNAEPNEMYCADCKAVALDRVHAVGVRYKNTAGLKWALSGIQG